MPVHPINFAMVLGLAQRRRFQTELNYAWMEIFNARVEIAKETNMAHHSANHDKKKKIWIKYYGKYRLTFISNHFTSVLSSSSSSINKVKRL